MKYLPTYCDRNLLTANKSITCTSGAAKMLTASGPRKLRGTTPGNSRWSYCNAQHAHNYSDWHWLNLLKQITYYNSNIQDNTTYTT